MNSLGKCPLSTSFISGCLRIQTTLPTIDESPSPFFFFSALSLHFLHKPSDRKTRIPKSPAFPALMDRSTAVSLVFGVETYAKICLDLSLCRCFETIRSTLVGWLVDIAVLFLSFLFSSQVDRLLLLGCLLV